MITAVGLRSLASLNISLSSSLSALLSLQSDAMGDLASIQTQLAACLSPPTLITPADLALAVGSIVATFNPTQIFQSISDQIGALQATIGIKLAKIAALGTLVAGIQALLGAGGATVMVFDGQANVAGQEIGAQMVTDFLPTASVKSVVITTDTEAVYTALKALFGLP